MPKLDERAMDALSSRALTPEEQTLRRELRAILESSFDAIPEIYRSVFMLREVEGLSTTAVAECLDVSEEAVKTRLHRARALLRQELFERAGLASAELFPLHLSRCDRVAAAVLAQLNLPPPPSRLCACQGEFCGVAIAEFPVPDDRS